MTRMVPASANASPVPLEGLKSLIDAALERKPDLVNMEGKEVPVINFGPPVSPALEYDNLADWRQKADIPTQYIFDGILARAIVACIAGMGGLGKSWIVLILAVSAITGKTLFPSFIPTRRHKTIYLAGEDDFSFVAKRLKAAEELYQVQFTEMELDDAMAANLRIMCARPQALVKVVQGKVQPTEFFKALLQEAATADFIIIDPVAKFHGLPTENENALVSKFMNLLQGLCVPNGALVLFTHHVNKGC